VPSQPPPPAFKERPQILKPEATPAAPAPAPGYSGPASGVMIWSGHLDKGATVMLDGGRASQGTLNGSLPGVPILVEVEPKDVGLAEAPSPSNGWKRLAIRSRKDKHTVVTIRWKVL